MDEYDNSIMGFDRRPPKKPNRFVPNETIVISDDSDDTVPRGEIILEQQQHPVKRENKSGTASDVSNLDENKFGNVGAKKKKKKTGKIIAKEVAKLEEKIKTLKKKIKQDKDSSEPSDGSSSSDTDHSSPSESKKGHKKRYKSEASSSSSSSSFSTSSSDQCSKRKKKNYRRHKDYRKGSSRKRRTSSKHYGKVKKHRRMKQSKPAAPSDHTTTSDDSVASSDCCDPVISPNNGPDNLNPIGNSASHVLDANNRTLSQSPRFIKTPNGFSWPTHSQSDTPSFEPFTPIMTVSTTTIANEHQGSQFFTLDQTVPFTGYENFGNVTGPSSQPSTSRSPPPPDIHEIMARFSAYHNETQVHAPMQISVQNSAIMDNLNEPLMQSSGPNGTNMENSNEQPLLLLNPASFVCSSAPADALPQTQQRSDPSSEQSSEEISESRGERHRPINLQKPRPNTDKRLYLSNPAYANICAICHDPFRNIVNHYKKRHITEEVYVSRISPKMAKRLRGDNFDRFDASCEWKGKFLKLRAICFFCGHPQVFPFVYWLDHVRIHSGEYSRTCSDCGANVMAQSHCGYATEMAENRWHNLMTDDLKCFICKECNFVQLEQKNMERHLSKQHGFTDTEIKDRFDVKVLLPSKRSIVNGQIASTTSEQLIEHDEIPAAINEREHSQNIEVLDEIRLGPLSYNGFSTFPTPLQTLEQGESSHYESKREFGWEQRLEEIYPRYARDVVHDNVVVNPWLDAACKTTKATISSANLFDFYKCMHPNCKFSTNEDVAMQKHLADHLNHIDIGIKNGEPIDIHKKSRNCPYCCLGPFKATHDLMNHMKTAHGSCTYQCSHCFYRCIEMDSIVLHHEQFHRNQKKEVYVVHNERKFTVEQLERMGQGKLEMKAVKRKNQFHEFECSYCTDFESSNVNELRNHLAIYHNSDFMFVIRRGEIREYIYIGAMSHWMDFEFSKCGHYKSMPTYLDSLEIYEAVSVPIVPISDSNFGFQPSMLQLEDQFNALEEKFEYRNYADYRRSRNVFYQCGKCAPEDLMANVQPWMQRVGYVCNICAEPIVTPTSIIQHLREHQNSDCYFSAEREEQMLQHMQKEHTDKMNFYYRKFETEHGLSTIKCSFGCGNCPKTGMFSIKLASEHYDKCHKDDMPCINIERHLNDEKIRSNETFTFQGQLTCSFKLRECSDPFANKADLLEHFKKYHPGMLRIKYNRKLVLLQSYSR